MPTLLLRLAAPMQSWGDGSRLEVRRTSNEPTKSGVIGMMASALGRSRDEPIDDLSSLGFGVRVDQPGKYITDYQTAHGKNDKISYVTKRAYLSDAVFLVGLEGELPMLIDLEKAINNPYYPLYLGRRSCPPTGKVSLGIRDKPLMESLTSEPWQASTWYKRKQSCEVTLDIVMDSPSDESSEYVTDVPISFSQEHRRFGIRGVKHIVNAVKMENTDSRYESSTQHDVFAQLRGD